MGSDCCKNSKGVDPYSNIDEYHNPFQHLAAKTIRDDSTISAHGSNTGRLLDQMPRNIARLENQINAKAQADKPSLHHNSYLLRTACMIQPLMSYIPAASITASGTPTKKMGTESCTSPTARPIQASSTGTEPMALEGCSIPTGITTSATGKMTWHMGPANTYPAKELSTKATGGTTRGMGRARRFGLMAASSKAHTPKI